MIALSSCDEPAPDGDTAAGDSSGTNAEKIQSWPLFRGDAQMQGRSREDLVGPLEIAWSFEPSVASAEEIAAAEAQETKTRLPKKLWPIEASPVIADGTVFVGSQDGRFFCDQSIGWGRKMDVHCGGSNFRSRGSLRGACLFWRYLRFYLRA